MNDEDRKLATFRCDRTLWDTFIKTARENGTDATAILIEFVRSYTDPSRQKLDIDKHCLDVSIPDTLLARIDAYVQPLKAEVGKLRSQIEALQQPKSPKPKVTTTPTSISNHLTQSNHHPTEIERPQQCPKCRLDEPLVIKVRHPEEQTITWKCKRGCRKTTKFDHRVSPPQPFQARQTTTSPKHQQP